MNRQSNVIAYNYALKQIKRLERDIHADKVAHRSTPKLVRETLRFYHKKLTHLLDLDRSLIDE